MLAIGLPNTTELYGVSGCLKSSNKPPVVVKPLVVSDDIGTVTVDLIVEFPFGCYCSSKLLSPP